LISFKEEAPGHPYIQTTTQTGKKIAMALHIHAKEWLSYLSKISCRILTAKTNAKSKKLKTFSHDT
jgi:hypothetical protein